MLVVNKHMHEIILHLLYGDKMKVGVSGSDSHVDQIEILLNVLFITTNLGFDIRSENYTPILF